ncbi:MAG: extracellular solute-binding protein [Planctomycetota bacterium]
MKFLFSIVGLSLVLSSVGLWWSFPDRGSEVPVIYWVTDRNPAREQQVALFHDWLIDESIGETVVLASDQEVAAFHERLLPGELIEAIARSSPAARRLWGEDGLPGVPASLPIEVVVPAVVLRLDTGNRNTVKQRVQSVSGVAGDVMDLGAQDIPFFVQMGVLTDLTEAGTRMGFAPDRTWEAVVPAITEDGRQYAFPCNVGVRMHWVNLDVFDIAGVSPPKAGWTFEEFEAIGKRVVEAANEPGERQTVFFTTDVFVQTMHRSLGLSVFNETLTASDLDDERFVRVLRLKHAWVYEDHLLPSAAEQEAFDTQSGYGGANMQLFNRDRFAMLNLGRFGLIQLRKFNDTRRESGEPLLRLAVAEPPHGGFRNTKLGTRSATVYVDGRPDLAVYFPAFLASEPYNQQIVADADALPPNPRFTELEAFIRPPDRPEEWGVHEPFARAANTIAIADVHSPFVTPSEVARHLKDAEDGLMTHRLTPEEAALQAAERIDQGIRQTLRESAEARADHERRVELQRQIDARLARGERVPADWIDNVFYRRYYAEQGWLE